MICKKMTNDGRVFLFVTDAFVHDGKALLVEDASSSTNRKRYPNTKKITENS